MTHNLLRTCLEGVAWEQVWYMLKLTLQLKYSLISLTTELTNLKKQLFPRIQECSEEVRTLQSIF